MREREGAVTQPAEEELPLEPRVGPAGLQTHGVLREAFTSEVDVVINEGVQRTRADQCQYGAEYEGLPIRKPTGFMMCSWR